ncbi:MAG: helix-turn-helix transcriptional regulator [Daejeonella sp.]|uniref:helix-turn-helix transcriptional regulator n=1 Tax=Daejeonella sp. TaxID=2805397 RepID=UPI003C731B19
MDQDILRKKLRIRRDSFGYSQEYMGMLLGISQPAYSDIESGKTNITDTLFKELKVLEGFEDFDLDQPVPKKIPVKQTIADLWPWGKTSFYIFVVIVGFVILDFVVRLPADITRGFDAGTGHDYGTVEVIMGWVFALLLGLSIYWLFWVKKWWKARTKEDKIA